jgi:transcriptional regulator with XRE-family HTH domain
MAHTISPDRLLLVRKHRRWSQTKLSSKAKLERRNIQRIENSKKQEYTVREETLLRLAEALSVKPGVLTGQEALPEDFSSAVDLKGERSKRDSRYQPGAYEIRLIKLDDTYAIVEFSKFRKSNPIGNIVARGIPNEAAGLRLTSSHSALVTLLEEARELLKDPDHDVSVLDFEFLIEDVEEELDSDVRPPSDVTANAAPINTTTEPTLHDSEVDQ